MMALCQKLKERPSEEWWPNDQINLLAKGLKFIPTPIVKETQIRRQLLKDFDQFARRMRLQFIFHGKNSEPHPFHVKSEWNPSAQPSVALESYLEEVKVLLSEIQLTKPKNNLPITERKALTSLKNNKQINLKKADKGCLKHSRQNTRRTGSIRQRRTLQTPCKSYGWGDVSQSSAINKWTPQKQPYRQYD